MSNHVSDKTELACCKAGIKVKNLLKKQQRTQIELADYIGVRNQCVTYWRSRGFPPNRCYTVCDFLKNEIKPWELRPDIFRK